MQRPTGCFLIFPGVFLGAFFRSSVLYFPHARDSDSSHFLKRTLVPADILSFLGVIHALTLTPIRESFIFSVFGTAMYLQVSIAHFLSCPKSNRIQRA